MSEGADTRAAAARAVADVVYRGRSLDDALPDRTARLPPQDRALAANLAYGVLRLWPRLDRWLGRLLARPLPEREAEIHVLIAIGLFQLEETRVPDHAAVAATVDAARALGESTKTGLVNACLRRWQREGEAIAKSLARVPEVVHAHPRWWLDALARDWPGDWEAIVSAANGKAPLWVRVNRRRGSPADYAALLADAPGVAVDTWPPAPEALRLERPLDVEELPGFAAGLVSVQDAAAQLAAGLVDPPPGARVLDGCAAPGGKAAHLLELAPSIALDCLDASQSRLARVGGTLERLGLAARLLAGDARSPAAWWDGRPYDRILLDAPCSGSGVVRRHPDIKLLRRPGDIASLARLQLACLDALWPLLAPAGRLVYCTCSVFHAEGSAQAAAFLHRHPDACALPLDGVAWGRACGPGRQILPGEAGVDGFYYACFDKPG